MKSIASIMLLGPEVWQTLLKNDNYQLQADLVQVMSCHEIVPKNQAKMAQHIWRAVSVYFAVKLLPRL